MQTKHINLHEIIWELTGECKNKCLYCGSKDAWNQPTDEDKICSIVDAIIKYPPQQIDISGGDPMLVSLSVHKYIIENLKNAKVSSVKILVNPKSLQSNPESTIKILNLYDWTGISVNTKEELETWINLCTMEFKYFSYTLITNFNLNNIFLYKHIEKFVKENNLNWQIQYTMYSDPNNISAIYNNNEAIETLFRWIAESNKNGIKIVLADNMITGTCSAGKHSLGILSNGDVIPCLSMRSWMSNIATIVQGNVLQTGLDVIWRERFQNQRFENFFCCKDHCKNKCPFVQMDSTEITTSRIPPIYTPPLIVDTPDIANRRYVYGTFKPRIT